jgi:hypothetical protein
MSEVVLAGQGEFTYGSHRFTVKRNSAGALVYREAEHLGGPWTHVAGVMRHASSYNPAFVKGLRDCAAQLG